MKFIVNLSRYFTAILFIISGLIKANDATGFSYKLIEYFEVFGTQFLDPLALGMSVFICAFEIFLGVALLFGGMIKQVIWGLLILIIFFTFLTFYSAFFNVVNDCGCFGDAVKLTPWQSFGKDILLLILISILFFNRNKIYPIINEKLAVGLSYVAFLASTAFGVYCIMHLPIIDFLPYKIGNNLPQLMSVPAGAVPDQYQIIYTMKNLKSGETKKMGDKEYLSSGIWEDPAWEYVSASDPVLVKAGYQPKIKDLLIADSDGNDQTKLVIENPEYNFLIIAENLTFINSKNFEKLNSIASKGEAYQIRTLGVTASSAQDVESFRHESNAMFEFYYCDATVLKTMIRANPGLILMKKGTVINKWHFNDIPDFESIQKMYLDK